MFFPESLGQKHRCALYMGVQYTWEFIIHGSALYLANYCSFSSESLLNFLIINVTLNAKLLKQMAVTF